MERGRKQREVPCLFSTLLWLESLRMFHLSHKKEKTLELNPEEHSKANPKEHRG